MNYKLIAYGMDFSSFLIQKLGDSSKVRKIILFGSVSRGEATSKSDVDIFVDIMKEDKKLEKECVDITNEFISSIKCKKYWVPLGIANEIKLTIGRLDDWKELHSSIISNGITLYDKFKMNSEQGKHCVLFTWENIHPNSIRVLFNKQMFGFKQNNKFYNGLIQKYNGERMSKGSILVPLEHKLIFHQQFKKYKIAVKMKSMVEI